MLADTVFDGPLYRGQGHEALRLGSGFTRGVVVTPCGSVIRPALPTADLSPCHERERSSMSMLGRLGMYARFAWEARDRWIRFLPGRACTTPTPACSRIHGGIARTA